MTITKTGLSYIATSLEDIAQEFDRLAANETKMANRIATGKAAATIRAESYRYAAAILRATKLEPPECEGRTITGADLAKSALKLKAAWDGAHISDNAFDRIAKAYTEPPSDDVGISDHGYRANGKGACRDCGGLLQNHKTITCG